MNGYLLIYVSHLQGGFFSVHSKRLFASSTETVLTSVMHPAHRDASATLLQSKNAQKSVAKKIWSFSHDYTYL